MEFSVQVFEKHSNIKFHGNPSSRSRVGTYERTDSERDRQMEEETVRHEETNNRLSQLCQRA
jgi:hypothetical protein